MMNQAQVKTEELKLQKFHCVDCAVTIEKTVAKMGGVLDVKANFSAGKVTIKYDPHKVQTEELIRSVERIGYEVKHDTFQHPEEKAFWKEPEFVFTLISGLFLATGLLIHFFTGDILLIKFLSYRIYLSSILYLIAIFWGAFFFSRQGLASVLNLRFNMDFLMTLAILGAVIIQEFVEAASLAFLFSVAELLEDFAIERARESLSELMELAPSEARVLKNGREITIPVEQIKIGDRVAIRPGEKVPVDGIIIEGASSLDQSPITGESKPISKKEGDKVYAGSINMEGYLEVQVTENPENTMLARIIHLVEEAEAQKAPSQKFVEKFAKYYTPSVVATAILVATVPPLLFSAPFHSWFIRSLTLLVIACPCALVISTPVSVVSALTNASRNGVLIKGGVYLEEMGKIKVLAFDKTGTLTQGQLQVTDVFAFDNVTREDVLRIAASLEMRSEHPIARAILDSAKHLALENIKHFESIPGKGVRATINGTTYLIGRPELFKDFNVALPEQELRQFQQQGKTTMLVGTDRQIIGIVALADEIRTEARAMIEELKKMHKEVVMITGDNKETARSIAGSLGITHYHAGLLPEEKVKEVKYLQKKYGKVAMVGDGINDAPALAVADVGIAMGVAGTDTALETADIALMSDDLSKLPYLVKLSEKAEKVIKQNIFTSILIKFSLALGVFPGIVSLVLAVLVGDMGASLGVTANAMRLAKIKSQ
ncbi:MAG: cadmium-translocating P-type ATPase [Calditrichaeota bacterium]|nr:MAG: cadmium-translocating P-type ATPase [Calditrichota bacterium]